MKYEIELWTRNDKLMADISKIATNRSWSRQRNEAETLQFDVDIEALQRMAAAAGGSAKALLDPYSTQFRLKRNGEYLFGGEIAATDTSLDENSGTINVRCWGYLNMLKDRYVSAIYQEQYMGEIAWLVIELTQGQTNGSMGITRGSQQFLGKKRDRTYQRDNVKSILQSFANLSDESLDFAFTYDKKFNVYAMIGSKRNDLEFIYPQNILNVSVPREATNLYNKIIGLGSGFGDDQLNTTQIDSASAAIYGIREKIQVFNSVVIQETLEENTAGYLDQVKSILEIPQITVNGDDIDLNTVIPGDRVPVRIKNHKFLESIDGLYRIERLEVNVDENEDESVKVYFDNHGI